MPNPPLFADRLIGSCMRDGERHLSELYRGSQQRQTTLQQMENAGASGLCMKAFILKLILPTKYWHMPRGSVKTKLAQLVKVIVDIRTDLYSHASVFTHLL